MLAAADIRQLAALLAGAVLSVAAAGCHRQDDQGAHERPSTPPEQWRIICGTPAIAELVFALGAGDRVAGVSDYTVWPPEAVAKPRIGGWVNPDRERLTVLAPDVILTQGLHERLSDYARDMGIYFRSVPLERFDEVLSQMEEVGALLGVPVEGQALRKRVEGELDAVRQAVTVAPRRRVAVLFARPQGDMTVLTAIGPETFLNDLIEIAGGINIFHDVRGDYPQVSKETLLVRQPEVIIELHSEPMTDARRRQTVEDWNMYSILPAVKDGRVVLLTDDFLLIPGPRMAATARRFAQAIHPECFDE